MCGDVCETEEVTLQENGIVRNKEGMIIGRMNKTVDRESIIKAVAQAWCTDENKNKEMDATLAETIVRNIWNIL